MIRNTRAFSLLPCTITAFNVFPVSCETTAACYTQIIGRSMPISRCVCNSNFPTYLCRCCGAPPCQFVVAQMFDTYSALINLPPGYSWPSEEIHMRDPHELRSSGAGRPCQMGRASGWARLGAPLLGKIVPLRPTYGLRPAVLINCCVMLLLRLVRLYNLQWYRRS